MQPTASSEAPVAASHESKWHPTRTISLGPLAPGQLANHVGGLDVGLEVRLHLQADAHAPPRSTMR